MDASKCFKCTTRKKKKESLFLLCRVCYMGQAGVTAGLVVISYRKYQKAIFQLCRWCLCCCFHVLVVDPSSLIFSWFLSCFLPSTYWSCSLMSFLLMHTSLTSYRLISMSLQISLWPLAQLDFIGAYVVVIILFLNHCMNGSEFIICRDSAR